MQKIERDDFLKLKAVSAPAWAPGGGKAAFLVHRANEEKNGYDSDLWLWQEKGGLRQLTGAGDVTSFVWDGDGAITFPAPRDRETNAAKEKGEDRTAFYTLPLEGGSAKLRFTVPLCATAIGKLDDNVFVLRARRDLVKADRLQNLTGQARERELAAIRDEGERFVIFDEYPFWSNGVGVTNKIRQGLWLYNAANGALTQITTRYFNVEAAAVYPREGKIVYHGNDFTTINDFTTGVWVYDYATGKTGCAVAPGGYRIWQVGWMGDRVVFAGAEGDQKERTQVPTLWTADPQSGEVTRLYDGFLSIGNPVGSDARYGGGSCFVGEGETLYLISGKEDESRLIAVDKAGKVTSLVEKTGSVDFFDVRDGKAVFVAMHDMRPQELYRTTPAGWERLTGFNQEFYDSHAIVHPEELRFTDPDGFEIHGFVLKPVGFDPGKKYPAILDIHGGPRLSYGAVYYHEMQYWANHGYFVFFANPRGSDARGEAFADIRGKFGTVEYQNLMDFTDRVLEQYPQIDQSRLGVTGGSYGGFMTNWIIGHTGRFAAAASQRSIANFITMEGTSDCGRTFAEGHGGATTAGDMLKLWSQSPLSAAHHCTTPTLFIHAEEDYRCWMVEGLQMFNAIREKGVDARFCLFKGENHELSRSGKPKNRRKRLAEITGWMDKYLKP